jgi:hypothetical protein
MEGGGKLLWLYRAILRLHREKLPPPMREMGDKYVKTEFSSHIHGKTSKEQWDTFTAGDHLASIKRDPFAFRLERIEVFIALEYVICV